MGRITLRDLRGASSAAASLPLKPTNGDMVAQYPGGAYIGSTTDGAWVETGSLAVSGGGISLPWGMGITWSQDGAALTKDIASTTNAGVGVTVDGKTVTVNAPSGSSRIVEWTLGGSTAAWVNGDGTLNTEGYITFIGNKDKSITTNGGDLAFYNAAFNKVTTMDDDGNWAISSQTPLASGAGSTVTPHSMSVFDANQDFLKSQLVRVAAGTDWTTAAWRIQRVVDATNEAWIQFGYGLNGDRIGGAIGNGSNTTISWDSVGSFSIAGNFTANGFATFGDGTLQEVVKINGTSAGTGGGSSLWFQQSGVTHSSIGSYSSVIGGAYDNRLVIYGALGIVNYHDTSFLSTIEVAGAATFSSNVNVNGTLTAIGAGHTIGSTSTEVDLFFSYSNSVAYRAYFSNTSNGTFGLNYTNASGAYTGTAWTMNNQTGAVTFNQNVNLLNGNGLSWSGGYTATVGSGGATLAFNAPAGSTEIVAFNVNGAPGSHITNDGTYWVDGSGGIRVGYNSGTANSIDTSGWFRSSGNTGWYNATYGIGVYAIDGTYVRTYNNASMAAADFVLTSDRRLKTGIRPFVMKSRLNPVTYFHMEKGFEEDGFISQDFEDDYPSMVGADPSNGMLNLSYSRTTVILAAQANRTEDALAQLRKEFDALRERYENTLWKRFKRWLSNRLSLS
jgi:hypothetical protein